MILRDYLKIQGWPNISIPGESFDTEERHGWTRSDMKVNSHCQPGYTWSHRGYTIVNVSMRVFPERFNQTEQKGDYKLINTIDHSLFTDCRRCYAFPTTTGYALKQCSKQTPPP